MLCPSQIHITDSDTQMYVETMERFYKDADMNIQCREKGSDTLYARYAYA